MSIVIDPAPAAIDAAGTVAWLLLSWFTFRLVVDTLHAGIKRARRIIDTTVVLTSIAQRVRRWLT